MKQIDNYLKYYIGQPCKWKYSEWSEFTDAILSWDVARKNTRNDILIKPILRRLNSITEQECRELGYETLIPDMDADNRLFSAEDIHYLLSKGFDLFDLIDSGLALDAATVKL